MAQTFFIQFCSSRCSVSKAERLCRFLDKTVRARQLRNSRTLAQAFTPKTGGAVRAGIFGVQNLQRFSGGRRFCRILNQQLHQLHVGRILGYSSS